MENQSQEIAKVVSYELTNNDHTKHLAGVVADFIQEKTLFTMIQGKKYVNVEGWLYAGSQLGILPVIVAVEDIGKEGEFRYRAEAKLINIHTQVQVGYGVAMCSNKEAKKKYFDEYAIMSMAETRAVGKAYRLMIGWLMSAAGYSPTPFEEMDNIVEPTEEKPKQKATTPKPEPAAQVIAEEKPVALPITANQKASILQLLNDSTINKEEKETMIAKVDGFDCERAEQAIVKLKKVIKDRSFVKTEKALS